jgi:N-methylhydantoinase B
MTQLKSVPSGLAGGGGGLQGRLFINGVDVDPTEPKTLQPGDLVLMETAGGGAYGV